MLLKAVIRFLVIWCAVVAGTFIAETSDNDRGAKSGFNLKGLTIKKASLMPAGGGGYEIATALSGGGGMDVGALLPNTVIQITEADLLLRGPAGNFGRQQR